MKLSYERPMMRAELYQTNAYCIGCGEDDKSPTGIENIRLGDALSWWSIPGSGDWGSNIKNNTSYQQYADLTFGGVQNKMTGTGGADQFYWTTTVGGKTYHLEWSAAPDGWSGDLNGYGKPNHGENAFVLYEEEGAEGSEHADALDAAVNTGDYWPGAGYDGDSEPTSPWNYLFPFDKKKYDNAIMAVVFGTVKSWWS